MEMKLESKAWIIPVTSTIKKYKQEQTSKILFISSIWIYWLACSSQNNQLLLMSKIAVDILIQYIIRMRSRHGIGNKLSRNTFGILNFHYSIRHWQKRQILALLGDIFLDSLIIVYIIIFTRNYTELSRDSSTCCFSKVSEEFNWICISALESSDLFITSFSDNLLFDEIQNLGIIEKSSSFLSFHFQVLHHK